MSDDHEETIQLFKTLTGADDQCAQFYMESAAWSLDLAVFRFFENRDNSDNPEVARAPDVIEISDSDPELLREEEEGSSARPPKKDKPTKSSNAKFATLQSLNQASSSEDEEGEAFYAGGSERSGQQIIGPGKNKDGLISSLFKSMKEHGATLTAPKCGASSSSSFLGTGYRLGVSPEDSAEVNLGRDENVEPEVENVVLCLWRNGFNIGNGEFRSYSDPANWDFLECIRRGEIPAELHRGHAVHLSMEDHRHENFNVVKSTLRPFQGEGHVLGSPTPTTIGSTSVKATSPTDKKANESAAQAALNLNEAEPTTTIQFRLADGTRLVGRFNLSHTVANLREYVIMADPSYQLQSFILLTPFPKKELTDHTQTIKDAGLETALVIQRLK